MNLTSLAKVKKIDNGIWIMGYGWVVLQRKQLLPCSGTAEETNACGSAILFLVTGEVSSFESIAPYGGTVLEI